MNYETKNKSLILSLLKNHKDEHLTIDQIKKLLKDENKDVPIASVYRNIDKFLEEGLIRKYVVNDNASCFQIVDEKESNHFHLLCSKCGKLIHLECDEVGDLIQHIEKEHNFEIDISKINLYGLCQTCRSKK